MEPSQLPTQSWSGSFPWLIGLVSVLYGVAGAVAIIVVRADLNAIDSAVLSRQAPPMLDYLAGAYSRMLRVGENTIATRLTLFRQAVIWVVAGGVIGLLGLVATHYGWTLGAIA